MAVFNFSKFSKMVEWWPSNLAIQVRISLKAENFFPFHSNVVHKNYHIFLDCRKNVKSPTQIEFRVKSILTYFRRSITNWHLNHLEGFEFWFFGNFTFEKVTNWQKFKLQSYWNGQTGSFWDFEMTKIDFTCNQSGRKMAKFPHCM